MIRKELSYNTLKKCLLHLFLVLHLFATGLSGQQGIYTITRTEFSSDKYDEFSPVYYKGGIVFVSDRRGSLVYNYSSSEAKGVLKIFYADTSVTKSRGKVRLFSKTLKTSYNDGPVCFNKSGDTIYLSMNLMTDRKLQDQNEVRNKLGIFSSVSAGNTWAKVRELRINNEWYNVTTPWLSSDSKTLYFASDMPGGFGGSDLYYSKWRNGYWDDPVNMGQVINTVGNEAFPFVISPGEIIFSSTGHKGLGGRDIFYSKYKDSDWLKPVPFDPPINSEFDDFGLVTDSLMNGGYFSSNREKSVDIFRFSIELPQVFYNSTQRTQQYCFVFNDPDPVSFDKRRFGYQWNFGEGQITDGEVVTHCFPGPGKYLIGLNLVEKATGIPVFLECLYELELRDNEQPLINGPDISQPGKLVAFDGLRSNLPGHHILDYTWYFGDGAIAKGSTSSHIYSGEGEFTVTLGVKAWQTDPPALRQYAVSKKIVISEATTRKTDANKSDKKINREKTPDFISANSNNLKVRYSASDEIRKGAVFRVELLTSRNRILQSNPEFKKFGQKYRIRELYNREDSLYSYVTDDEGSIMESYPVLAEAVAMGFKSAMIKTSLLREPAEMELNTLKKAFGLSSDIFFERNNERLTTAGYAFLDQITLLMNKYPGLRIFIEVHCDEAATDWSNLVMSQKRAGSLVKYLISKNINPNRFIAEGFGRSRRIITVETSDSTRKVNSRLQFRIIS